MADRGLARPPNTADKKKKKPKSQGEPGDSKPTPRHDCFQSHMAGVKHLYTPPILARKHTSSSLVAELEQLAEALQSTKRESNDAKYTLHDAKTLVKCCLLLVMWTHVHCCCHTPHHTHTSCRSLVSRQEGRLMEKDAALTQLQNKCDNTVEQLKVIHMHACTIHILQQIHAYLHAFRVTLNASFVPVCH